MSGGRCALILPQLPRRSSQGTGGQQRTFLSGETAEAELVNNPPPCHEACSHASEWPWNCHLCLSDPATAIRCRGHRCRGHRCRHSHFYVCGVLAGFPKGFCAVVQNFVAYFYLRNFKGAHVDFHVMARAACAYRQVWCADNGGFTHGPSTETLCPGTGEKAPSSPGRAPWSVWRRLGGTSRAHP